MVRLKERHLFHSPWIAPGIDLKGNIFIRRGEYALIRILQFCVCIFSICCFTLTWSVWCTWRFAVWAFFSGSGFVHGVWDHQSIIVVRVKRGTRAVFKCDILRVSQLLQMWFMLNQTSTAVAKWQCGEENNYLIVVFFWRACHTCLIFMNLILWGAHAWLEWRSVFDCPPPLCLF